MNECLRQASSLYISSVLTEIKCIVFQFAILLGIIFVLEIAAGAYAYSRRDKVS